jgi:hypothetical protein
MAPDVPSPKTLPQSFRDSLGAAESSSGTMAVKKLEQLQSDCSEHDCVNSNAHSTDEQFYGEGE